MANMQLTFQDLYNRVSKFLGTYGSSGPSGTDLSDAKDYVRSGYMSFLLSYPWSFLRKTTTLSTETGVYVYQLPTDFRDLRGSRTLNFSANSSYPPVTETGEDEVNEQRAINISSSYPQLFAIRTGDYSPETGQRYEMIFWPMPDATYVLTYPYTIMPAAMANTTDIPIGGIETTEVIKEFCLAAAETEADEVTGVHSNLAQMELVKAITADKERAPRHLGSMSGRRPSAWEYARGSTRINDVVYNV